MGFSMMPYHPCLWKCMMPARETVAFWENPLFVPLPPSRVYFRLTAILAGHYKMVSHCETIPMQDKYDVMPSHLAKIYDDGTENCGVLRKSSFLTPTPLQGLLPTMFLPHIIMIIIIMNYNRISHCVSKPMWINVKSCNPFWSKCIMPSRKT